jgi:hypothetical protein
VPFLEEIAAKLVAAGVGTYGTGASSPARSIFSTSRAIIPSGSGPYMTLVETGGTAPTRVQSRSGATTKRPTAQIMVRASDYASARAMCQAAYDALDGVFNTTLSGVNYLSITARQEPTDIGLDDAGRAMVAFNILCEKEP